MQLDALTGAFQAEATLQGAGSDSSWSRGLGWATAGLAWAFAVTGEPELLSGAERAADYYERHAGVEELPVWDFADPSPAPVPDASAAAAVALGYVLLGRIHPDGSRRGHYERYGRVLLSTIARTALNTDAGTDGVLLRSNYSVPHGRGVDGATAWGDFFVGLALALTEGVVSLEQVLGAATLRYERPVG
jgi:unsaturated chondroitin disaccharide hydrolase